MLFDDFMCIYIIKNKLWNAIAVLCDIQLLYAVVLLLYAVVPLLYAVVLLLYAVVLLLYAVGLLLYADHK